jgi:hypothetical protein
LVATKAVVAGAMVTITNSETGLRRNAKTDDSGRFNFPQLKPGIYSVKVEASGFELRQNNNVVSALGQKQTVDFTLGVARSNETGEVSSGAPILNPENANTSTTLNAPALEDLPNPGGDLTYPLQFAPGALINTQAAAMILLAVQTGTATWSSTACLPSSTVTSLTGWKRMTRSPTLTAVSPPISCWG